MSVQTFTIRITLDCSEARALIHDVFTLKNVRDLLEPDSDAQVDAVTIEDPEAPGYEKGSATVVSDAPGYDSDDICGGCGECRAWHDRRGVGPCIPAKKDALLDEAVRLSVAHDDLLKKGYKCPL